MDDFLPIGKYSPGMGDRFARQSGPQLRACLSASALGADIVPVWNKSHREHLTIGSDPAQTRALRWFDSGLHLKTARATRLGKVIGLAEGGGEGLAVARDIYAGALEHAGELCRPCASVLNIDPDRLPPAGRVARWNSVQFVSALLRDPRNPAYNPHLRQLLHLGYKIAAGMGTRYLNALSEYEAVVSRNVTENLFDRHISPVFLACEGLT